MITKYKKGLIFKINTNSLKKAIQNAKDFGEALGKLKNKERIFTYQIGIDIIGQPLLVIHKIKTKVEIIF